MSGPDPELLELLLARIVAGLAQQSACPLVVGLCGAQGSGKSTLVAALAQRLTQGGTATATLSLDDLYLTKAERAKLAREVHPMLGTRGVPGTHDVALGLAKLAALARGEAAGLPRFDKALDDRAPSGAWPSAPSNTQVLLLEGWCLGARPQAETALAAPINALEAGDDPDGICRGYANAALSGPYQALFARIDLLILLAAPSWEVVAKWREQQEAELRATSTGLGVMTPAEVQRFIQHYERLTRHILAEMKSRADVVVRLEERREVLAIAYNGEPSRSRSRVSATRRPHDIP